MPDVDIRTAEDAKRIIAEVSAAQRASTDKLDGLDKKVEALMSATRALQEGYNAAQLGSIANLGNSDAELRAYIERTSTGTEVVRLFGNPELPEEDYEPGLLDDPKPRNEWQLKAQKLTEQLGYCKLYMPRRDDGRQAKPERTLKAIRKHFAKAPESIKRIFGDGAGVGAEWIPDVHLPMLERDLFLQRRLESIFDTITVTDKNTLLPFLSVGLQPFKKGAPVTDDPGRYRSSSSVTEKISIVVEGLATRAQVDEDASEDAIINSQDIIRQETAQAHVDASEDWYVNGDTAAVHQDAIATWNIRSRWNALLIGGADDHRRLGIGLRARAYDVSNTTDQSAATTYAGYLAARAKLASPHGVAGQLVIVTSPEYYLAKMLNFAEVVTLDKFGAQATILSGQLAALGGAPVILSEFMGADLAATGLFTGSGATTGMLVFNRTRFKVAVRQGARVQAQQDITRGITDVVTTERKLFFTLDSPLATKKNVHFSFNLPIS